VRDEAPDQRHVAGLANLPAKPQTRLVHDGQSHPHHATLFLDTNLVGLDLSQVTRLSDRRRLDGLAVNASAPQSTCYRALVEAERDNDGL
jgi:hypothetical protein